MAGVSVSFAESAVRDLEGIHTWYEGELVPEVGQRITADILERIEALRDNPYVGRVVPEFQQRYLREVIFPPFRIVYTCEATKVRVVRVWRSERLLTLSQ